MGRTGAVEADVSLAAVGVPDGRLVEEELVLLVGKDRDARRYKSVDLKLAWTGPGEGAVWGGVGNT